ncbi:MAG: Aromatic amino acid permease [Parcubacteria group bacterium GW2011_GWA1_Parcubacteria_45_10]|nr:MAG: Aromatic amino acid permease [Parcubacteria group bacterium GW2011_GWA1_Parcubacteria_45_10]KKT88625.1 MAG: Aromatic amino acid permease [Parcubacteria group bacterium GW2011_GWB1_45_10]
MLNKKLAFFEGTFLLIGTIIGAGYLTLPYSFLKAGIWSNLFWLLFLIFFVTLLHLFYAEVVLATPTRHRFPGYVSLYLGKVPGLVAKTSFVFGVFGSLLVYLLLGSHFFELLLKPFLAGFNGFWGLDLDKSITLIFGLAMSALVALKINLSAKINFFITILTLFLFLIISGFASLKINPVSFLIKPEESFFFPFGLVLFSLVGSLIIPEILKFLEVEKQDKKLIKPIVIWGTLIPGLIYLFFAFSIFGASGQHTTKEAIAGLSGILPQNLVFLGVLLAFLEILTSYLGFGINTVETLRKDFNFSKLPAKFLVGALPLSIFFFGASDFLKVMGFLGALLVALDSVLLAKVYAALKIRNPGYQFQIVRAPKALVVFAVAVMVLGGAFSLYFNF